MPMRPVVIKSVIKPIQRVGFKYNSQDIGTYALKSLYKAVVQSLFKSLNTATLQAYPRTVQPYVQNALTMTVYKAVQTASSKAEQIDIAQAATKAGSKYPCTY